MSFEGYYQLRCKNNHYTTMNVYDYDFGHDKCPYCNESFDVKNLVDTTNGDNDGYDHTIEEGSIRPVTVMPDTLDSMRTRLEELQEKVIALEKIKDIAEESLIEIIERDDLTSSQLRSYARSILKKIQKEDILE